MKHFKRFLAAFLIALCLLFVSPVPTRAGDPDTPGLTDTSTTDGDPDTPGFVLNLLTLINSFMQ